MTTSSREQILKRVRKALLNKSEALPSRVDWESDVFTAEEGALVEVFAENWMANFGYFIYCYHAHHFIDQFITLTEEMQWKQLATFEPELQALLSEVGLPIDHEPKDVLQADVGITGCETLVARTGSIIVSSKGNAGRSINIFPPAHVVVAWKGQLVYDLSHYLSHMNRPGMPLPSMTSIISGPSRTADIEKTLVMGAHGPKAVFVFYIEEEKPRGNI